MTYINAREIAETPQSQLGLKVPSFYHRQYDNDIPKTDEPKTAFDQCKRVGSVALPFIGLCKSFAMPLSLVSDGMRSISSLSKLVAAYQAGDNSQIASGVLNSAVSVASIAGTL